MQLSIYYKEEDQYIIEMVEKVAQRNRMSKAAVILSILEDYFEAEKRIGEILQDMRAINNEKLTESLHLQKKNDGEKRLGEIMVEEEYVNEDQLNRALRIQGTS